ncbi:metallophosphoesterase family protein [Actinoallomurus soli]|uniref:hypothetical protein n=1 Tax=Actinoallomurus soli TaxID=2952535 RepID=UPI0020938063|nr:hypothetical protein [Actinoallomurus soli]MCO5971330.1 hypothetical protein [Actinoallomurus soli]
MLTRMLAPAALALPLALTASALPAAAPAMARSRMTTVGRAADPAQDGSDASDPNYMIAVGDIPSCGLGFNTPSPKAIATAKLALSLRALHSSLEFTGLGDQNNDFGTFKEFTDCYAKSGWGALKSVTHPSLGNHEQYKGNENATGYFKYFGGAAGSAAKPYYAFDVGTIWHFIALDSECQFAGGCQAGSPQEKWLRDHLTAYRKLHPHRCILAYWHRPLFSSSDAVPRAEYTTPQVYPFWQDLYAAHAAIVMNGHFHGYERFAPQTPNHVLDQVGGIREFVVATGGSTFYGFHAVHAAHSQVRLTDVPGVMLLTLKDRAYDWTFYDTTGKMRDSGVDQACPQ